MAKQWLVRRNCEYSTVVEAETEEEAVDLSLDVPPRDWDVAWGLAEAERED